MLSIQSELTDVLLGWLDRSSWFRIDRDNEFNNPV